MEREKNTFIRHESCESCGSSDANALYSDGSKYCFSCRKATLAPKDSPEIEVGFKAVQSRITFEEIETLPTEGFRGISREVMFDAGVKVEYDTERKIIASYYPITTNKKVRAYKRKSNLKEYVTIGTKVEVSDLFNQSNCGKRKNLVITEGEIDTLSLLEAMRHKDVAKMDVVSISFGCQSARRNVASNLEFVNKYQKVFIAFDNDDVGKEAAQEVAHIITPGKAFIVECDKYKDANEALQAKDITHYLQCLWGSKSYKPDSFVSGEKVWDAFQERKSVKSIPYPSCLNGINKKILGTRKGEITLFTSGTGSGKSTVVKEIILNLLEKTEDKIGLISLEESIGDTATKLIGMTCNKFINSPEDLPEAEARKAYEKVFADERLILIDHQGSVQDNSLLQRIEYLAAMGCSHLILDHITIAVSEGADGLSGNEAVDKVMSELLKITKRYNIHLTLISHLRKSSGQGMKSFEEGRMATMDDIKGSGSIKQISFDIIAFARDMTNDDIIERNKIHFSVLKSRFNGNTGRAGHASYDPTTARLSEEEDKVSFDIVSEPISVSPQSVI